MENKIIKLLRSDRPQSTEIEVNQMVEGGGKIEGAATVDGKIIHFLLEGEVFTHTMDSAFSQIHWEYDGNGDVEAWWQE